jgi:hypothetical protein
VSAIGSGTQQIQRWKDFCVPLPIAPNRALGIDVPSSLRYAKKIESIRKLGNIRIKGGSVKRYQYTVLFEPREDGYNVIVPAIPVQCLRSLAPWAASI